MDIKELFSSCRKGDVSRVRYLLEERDIDPNVRDKWDSTPLYYACLCGHEELVKYMLENGARCEANTFDGERCLYGALNNEIRNLLKSYKQVTSTTMRRDNYTEFLRRMFEQSQFADLQFIIHGKPISAHRSVLATRSQYFAEMLLNKWKDKETICINHSKVQFSAFKCMLHYLYTGCMDVHIDEVEDILLLAKQCRLEQMAEVITDTVVRVESFAASKPGMRVTMISLDPSVSQPFIQQDLGVLADLSLPPTFTNQVDTELPFPSEDMVSYADMIVTVGEHKFHCHKSFMLGRSDYFKALLVDHFGEQETDEEEPTLPVIQLRDVSPEIFVQVLYYIYQDYCEQLTAQNVYDVLMVADLYLLQGLKRQCSGVIGRFLDMENFANVLRVSRLFNLARLEDQCAEFMAQNLEKVLESEDFIAIVQEDADSVETRHETDSITVIDEIRHYITSYVQTFSDMYDADQKLALIDNFLGDLGLDA